MKQVEKVERSKNMARIWQKLIERFDQFPPEVDKELEKNLLNPKFRKQLFDDIHKEREQFAKNSDKKEVIGIERIEEYSCNN